MDARIGGVDYRSLVDVDPRYPYHPYRFLCERKLEIKYEAPKENCPLCGPIKDQQLIERLQVKGRPGDTHRNPHRIGDFSW